MAITRSPFVKKQTIDYGYGVDEQGNTTYTNAQGVTTVVGKGNKTGEDRKSTLAQEQSKLGRAVNKAGSLARLAPFSKGAQDDFIESLKQLKETGKSPKGLGLGLLNTLGQGINLALGEAPAKAFEKYGKAVAPVLRTAQSGIVELGEGIDALTKLGYADKKTYYERGSRKGEEIKPSWSDFVKQAKDPNFKIWGKDSLYGREGKTGTALQFFADVATDPSSFASLPASQANKASKVALATRVVTELYPKYPELKAIPNLLDNIVRHGAVEIPPSIRQAENIFVGVKYMGFEIKSSAAIAQAWRHTLGEVKPAIGDVLYKSPKIGQKIQNLGSSSSMALLNKAGIGRGLVEGDDWVNTYLGGIAEKSSSIRYRSAESIYNSTHMAKGYPIMREIEMLPAEQQQQLYRIIENRSVVVVDEALAPIVERYKMWADEAYGAVEKDRVAKIQQKWGALIKPLGVIDDHIHHSMDDKAKEWINSGKDTDGWFDDADFSGNDLETGKGISSYRKLRDATFDENGNLVHAETFMGEQVIIGSIEAINEISMRKIGIPWFKTDIPTIMKDTLASYGRMVGRTAYYDRMMDFGPAVIKPLIKHVVPDKELVGVLQSAADELLDVQKLLSGRVARGVNKLAGTREGVTPELESVLRVAATTLAGKNLEKKAIDKTIKDALKRIKTIKTNLEKATKSAAKLTAQKKGESNDVILSLTKQIEDFESALINGTGERFITMQELHKQYMAFYPDANDWQGKSAEWLAERIVRAAGGADAIEARESARIAQNTFLREQIDALPEVSVQERQILENKLFENEKELEAIQRINQVKNNASYASEGWVYGFVPDAAGEPAPFQIFTTAPMDNEFGSFRQMDDAIAGHAIPETDLLDLRNPETFNNFLNPEFWADDLNRSWREVGINDYLQESDVANMVENNGVLDPDFIRVNPEKAELLMGMWDMKMRIQNSLDDGLLDNMTHDDLGQFFNWFQDMQRRIAYSFSPNNSDAVGNLATQWWFKNMVDDSVSNGYKGVLLPATNIFGDSYQFTSDEWAVLFPNNWKTPKIGQEVTDPWQTVKGNKFLQNSLDGTLENHQLSMLNNNQKLREMGIEVEETLSKRAELESNLAVTSAQENTFNTLMRLRNADNVLLNGKDVPRTQVLKKLAQTELKLQKVYDSVDREVKKTIEAKFGVKELETQRLSYEERLPMLLDQAKVLETWTEGAGEGLKQEIQDMVLLLKSKPAKGSTGASNAAYVDKVLKTIETSSLIDEPDVRSAYDRVTTILHADEIKLAAINDEVEESLDWLQMAKMGLLNGKVVNNIAEAGWTEIRGLGLQMPDEVLKVWGPNIKKLNNQVEYQAWMKNIDKINNYWKKWVTATPGFFIRNGFSGTFMNYADGVTNDAIGQGIKWATIQNETKRGIAAGDTFANWTSRAGLTGDDLAKAEWVQAVVAATGHGVTDDFAAPTIARSKAGVYTDKYLNFYNRKNKYIERALRMPMAIDSFNKNQSFDEAVERINRIHFDYSDLSKLDKYAKRVVPFWIWTSRNVPLQLSQIATRPKAYYEYERFKKEMPVNANLIMPKWISDKGAIGAIGNWVLTPDLPQQRLAQQLQSITTFKGLAGQATLPLKLATELASNRPLGIDTGPFKDEPTKGYTKYMAYFVEGLLGTKYAYYDENNNLIMDGRVNYILESVFPVLAQVNRVTGGVFGGKDTLEERMVSSWFNFFGIPARKVGPTQERSEVIRRRFVAEDLQETLKKLANKEEAQTEEP